ncbi:nucleotide-binding universal stress UspA family protein [Chitinophaga skermanii]|uniref:Nucleotide-binding universal stress UspA family protein n=1 Tax=Chitinophaga skermanii TaxID=331697 RepID=A0A327QCY0_9BACT|nr:universal stress protein [Chitinophaga skermanii]RAJ02419.1 nucleotide-binding universal stress UspA family protein [Chitinophaga skermanii]
MKKIIAVFDGLFFSTTTLDYALAMSKQLNSHLVGVFLDDKLYNSFDIYEIVKQQGAATNDIMSLEIEDDQTRNESVQRFENACKEAGISYAVHRKSNPAIQEIIHESIYADLLIIDQKETFKLKKENPPTTFLRNLLSDVQCPVLAVKGEYKPIDKVVLLYDGAPSAVYAIKMYSYLAPAMKSLTTEVISVNEAAEDFLQYDDGQLMKEFMVRHFKDATFTVFTGEPEGAIIKHLASQTGNTLVVLGAYRRSNVSRWFRASMADILMEKLHTPLFVAHNK